MRIFGFLFFFIVLASCMSRYPTFSKEYTGTLMTCKEDSSSLTEDTLVRLKKKIRYSREYCLNCKYSACADRPDYYDFALDWPSQVYLEFKKKTYFFITNCRPHDPEIKYGEPGFTISYDVDFGTTVYDTNHKTITLSSDKWFYKRTFYYEYSNQDSILTLRYKTAL